MTQAAKQWPVSVLCAVLEVSRSGFYADGQRHASVRAQEAAVALLARVKAIAAQTRCSYGSRRMAKQLQADGLAVGRYTARRLMHQAEVVVQRRKKRQPVPTDSRHRYGIAPHVLARAFDVEQPNHVWVGDVPYVWTAEGWLYVAVLLDLYARKGVGGAMSPHVEAALVQAALRMAVGRRLPAAGLLHHTDRGSQ